MDYEATRFRYLETPDQKRERRRRIDSPKHMIGAINRGGDPYGRLTGDATSEAQSLLDDPSRLDGARERTLPKSVEDGLEDAKRAAPSRFANSSGGPFRGLER